MPAESNGEQGFFARSVAMKWVFVTAAALIVVMAVVVAAILLAGRGDDEADRASKDGATAGASEVASPYDLVELPAETQLHLIEDAAFVSVFLPNDAGTLTSYGISSDLPATKALSEAILESDEIGNDDAAEALGAKAAGSTITFVLPSRETLTFALYLDQGMIARGAQVWRPEGDLKALVEAAVAGPQ